MFTVKAFRTKYGDTEPEIRRFPVSSGITQNFEYLQNKVVEIFQGLTPGNYQVFWKDDESDLISISSQEELTEALKFMDGNVLRIYITDIPVSSAEKTEGQTCHEGILCDGCNGPIYGSRFKCIVCPNYDLCTNCEKTGLHLEHDMMKYMKPQAREYCTVFDTFPYGVYKCGKKQFKPMKKRFRKFRKCMKLWNLQQGAGVENSDGNCHNDCSGGDEEWLSQSHGYCPYRRKWKCKRDRRGYVNHCESSGSDGTTQESDPNDKNSDDIADMMEPLSINKECAKRRKIIQVLPTYRRHGQCSRRKNHETDAEGFWLPGSRKKCCSPRKYNKCSSEDEKEKRDCKCCGRKKSPKFRLDVQPPTDGEMKRADKADKETPEAKMDE